MSLTLLTPPGFTELADDLFAEGAAVAEETMQALNAATKFAAVRNEQFWGFYKHGETVVAPTSAADGYVYERAELLYSFSRFCSGPVSGALGGTQTAPTAGANSGGGQLLSEQTYVDQATGVVTCITNYYATGGSQTPTNDGVVLVITHAQRSR